MFKKIISLALSVVFSLQTCGFAQVAQLNLTGYLGRAGSVSALDRFRPASLRYFSYEPKTDDFRILLDKADEKGLSDIQVKDKADELMKYFRIGLSLPNDKFWVNLRPDAPEQIIDPALEQTDIGKIMLAADLQLKKDTASFTSPRTKEGKEYWNKLYQKAGELFGSENITIPTITRPWIVPGEIIVRESGDSAYIYKAALKVMLEEDYLTSRGGSRTAPTYQQYVFSDPRLKELNQYSTQLIRELIIPKLTKEVNRAKRYAGLRQVFYSLVLSRWFKDKFNQPQSGNELTKLIDSGNLSNLSSKQAWDKTTYFKAYQKSFKEGEYSLSEPVYTPTGQVIRRYMSGGTEFTSSALEVNNHFANRNVNGRIPFGVHSVTLNYTSGGVTVAIAVASPVVTAELKNYRDGLLLTIKAYGGLYSIGLGDFYEGIGNEYKVEINAVKKAKDWASLLKAASLFYKKIKRLIKDDEVSKLQKEIYENFLGTYRLISKRAIEERLVQSLQGLDLELVKKVMGKKLKLSEYGEKLISKWPLGLRLPYNNIDISNWMKPQEGSPHYGTDIKCINIELSEILRREHIGFKVVLYSNGDVGSRMSVELVEDFTTDEGEISNIDWLTERIALAITNAATLAVNSEQRKDDSLLRVIKDVADKFSKLTAMSDISLSASARIKAKDAGESLMILYSDKASVLMLEDICNRISEYKGYNSWRIEFKKGSTNEQIEEKLLSEAGITVSSAIEGKEIINAKKAELSGIIESALERSKDIWELEKRIWRSRLEDAGDLSVVKKICDDIITWINKYKFKIDKTPLEAFSDSLSAIMDPVKRTKIEYENYYRPDIVMSKNATESGINNELLEGVIKNNPKKILRKGEEILELNRFMLGSEISVSGLVYDSFIIYRPKYLSSVLSQQRSIVLQEKGKSLKDKGSDIYLYITPEYSETHVVIGNQVVREELRKQLDAGNTLDYLTKPIREALIKASKVSSSLTKQVGGIDFRQMNMLIQPMGSFAGLDFSPVALSSLALEAMDLDKELEGIARMASGSMLPSPQRLKEYISACIFKGKVGEKADEFVLSMLEVFQLQAEEGIESSAEEREAVVMADTRRYVLEGAP